MTTSSLLPIGVSEGVLVMSGPGRSSLARECRPSTGSTLHEVDSPLQSRPAADWPTPPSVCLTLPITAAPRRPNKDH
jgi:hypothetical protein